MAQPIVDQVLTEMSEHHPEAFIRLKFPREKFRVITTKLDKELTIKTRRSDRVMVLQSVSGKRVVHFEFQLRYNRKVPERLFVYAGALTAKYQMKVASYLFLIKPSRLVGDFGVYQSDLFDETVNEFRFPVIRLFELREAILSGEARYRIFAPLVLEMESKPKIALLRQIRDILNQEPNARRRSEFFSFAAAIAKKHFDLKTIQSVFKEADMIDVDYWKNLPHFGDAMRANENEVKKEAFNEGVQHGLSGMQEMLIEFLSDQFGSLPNKTTRAIQTIHAPNKLKTIMRKSRKAESLAEVQSIVMAAVPKTNGRNGSAHKLRLSK